MRQFLSARLREALSTVPCALPLDADPKVSCRLAPIAVTPSSFNVRGPQSLIKWYPENNTVSLALLGIANPTLITMYPNIYGMTSASLWVNTKVGINTAFYVSATCGSGRCQAGCLTAKMCCHLQTATPTIGLLGTVRHAHLHLAACMACA
jgi:hypothetical protein